MRMAEAITSLKNVEKRAEKEYQNLLKALNSPEYADLRVLLMRMALDTMLHRRIVEAIEKAYKDSIKLIEKFGYGEVPEIPEDAPRLQVSSDLVLIPGMPALPVGHYGFLGGRIPPEDVLKEIIDVINRKVVLPPEKIKEVESILKKIQELSKEMAEHYRELEKRAVHPIIQSIAEAALKNEEQHRIVVEELLEEYSKKPSKS
ncbi:MAG: hypothetical protein PWQ79_1665 [Thermococcaceae archaeon]|nr:hypothetical protein [Thermococcaceae archaeon]MDK2914750.1 hypothetical protein [Thermococcaceae archaeon]